MKTHIKIIFLAILLGFPLKSVAKLIELPDSITLEIPDNYKRIESKNTFYSAVDTISNCFLFIASPDIKDFNIYKVLKSMDTICYNMSNMQLKDEESEWIFQWNKDYKKRYYENESTKCVTYTSYSPNRPYCILFSYQTEDDLDAFDEIIDSIKYNGNFLDKTVYVYNNASIFWIIIFLICGFSGCANHDNDSEFSSAWGIAVKTYKYLFLFLIIPLWGSWSVLFFVPLIFSIEAFITCLFSFYFTIEFD